MLNSPPVVALIGKLGHGKTFLLNKVTGTRFASNMGSTSCTRTLQYGYTPQSGVLVVDTPGFYASDDLASHIGAQKLALEGTKLSGVYIVMKFGRADEIAESAGKLMTFIGDDNVRIIITWSDTASLEEGYDPVGLLARLSDLLCIPVQNMIVIGKDTNAATIESFIVSTLHEPKDFKISEEQVAAISSLCISTRKFNKAIDEVYAKIAAASKACADLVKGGKTYETDTAIATIQGGTSEMVQASKENIFRDAEEMELDDDQKHLIYGKAGLSLSLKLKTFIEASNKLLTWDVTNPCDSRNVYKKCNYCGAVFNKTEGCDGATVCGSVPGDIRKPRPKLLVQFQPTASNHWVVQYFWDGKEIQVHFVLKTLADFFRQSVESWGGGFQHMRRANTLIESGCGATISWSTMLPVDARLVESLGGVELQHPGHLERESKASFESRLHQSVLMNTQHLNDAFTAGKK